MSSGPRCSAWSPTRWPPAPRWSPAAGGQAHLPTGYYIEPTLLSDVDPRSAIGQDETFGPVVTVTPYDTEDEAIAIANDTIYGLAGEVSSGDDDHALAVALKVHTGTIGANVGSTFSLTSPLGGVRQSGLGRRYGEQGFEEYLEIKAIGLPCLRLPPNASAVLIPWAFRQHFGQGGGGQARLPEVNLLG